MAPSPLLLLYPLLLTVPVPDDTLQLIASSHGHHGHHGHHGNHSHRGHSGGQGGGGGGSGGGGSHVTCASLVARLGLPCDVRGRQLDDNAKVMCVDEAVCSLDATAPRSNQNPQRKAMRSWWCSLAIDRSSPILMALGDGLSGDSFDWSARDWDFLASHWDFLASHRVPVSAQCGPRTSTVYMHEALEPGFAFRKPILLPDYQFLRKRGYEAQLRQVAECDTFARPFARKQASIVFRGSSSGLSPRNTTRAELMRNDRLRATMLTKGLAGWDVAVTNTAQLSPEVGALIRAEGLVAGQLDHCQMQGYQGVLDIDGNTNSWEGLFIKLSLSSIVFKMATPNVQWYYRDLRPGVDYVEVDAQMTQRRELPSQLASLQHIAERRSGATRAILQRAEVARDLHTADTSGPRPAPRASLHSFAPEATRSMSYHTVSAEVERWWAGIVRA